MPISGGAGILTIVSGGATNTWNPLDKDADIALSNGNLSFTKGAGGTTTAVRAVASASSGKKYWEIHPDTVATVGFDPIGFANASALLSDFIGKDTNGIGWAGDGNVYLGGSSGGSIQAWAVGDTLCFALDMGNHKIWFRTNGGNWNNDVIGNQDPANNIGGIDYTTYNGFTLGAGPYFAAGCGNGNGDAFTANFGGSAFAQTVPAGFGNW